jgi:hypothetical protein
MRWIWLTLSIVGFAVAWMAKTPGLLAFGLIVGLIAITCAVFAIAADRIQDGSRPESMMMAPGDMDQLRNRTPVQRPQRPAAQPTPIRPPPPRN